ncbi:hypothetical protein FB451DRAFT_1408559 [Mycena latifolia]|nr:hypothetical protein FB451DRAFT_1408559 [Mycena latifolia]
MSELVAAPALSNPKVGKPTDDRGGGAGKNKTVLSYCNVQLLAGLQAKGNRAWQAKQPKAIDACLYLAWTPLANNVLILHVGVFALAGPVRDPDSRPVETHASLSRPFFAKPIYGGRRLSELRLTFPSASIVTDVLTSSSRVSFWRNLASTAASTLSLAQGLPETSAPVATPTGLGRAWTVGRSSMPAPRFSHLAPGNPRLTLSRTKVMVTLDAVHPTAARIMHTLRRTVPDSSREASWVRRPRGARRLPYHSDAQAYGPASHSKLRAATHPRLALMRAEALVLSAPCQPNTSRVRDTHAAPHPPRRRRAQRVCGRRESEAAAVALKTALHTLASHRWLARRALDCTLERRTPRSLRLSATSVVPSKSITHPRAHESGLPARHILAPGPRSLAISADTLRRSTMVRETMYVRAAPCLDAAHPLAAARANRTIARRTSCHLRLRPAGHSDREYGARHPLHRPLRRTRAHPASGMSSRLVLGVWLLCGAHLGREAPRQDNAGHRVRVPRPSPDRCAVTLAAQAQSLAPIHHDLPAPRVSSQRLASGRNPALLASIRVAARHER